MGGIFLEKALKAQLVVVMKKKYIHTKKELKAMSRPGRLSETECMEMDMTPKERNVFLVIDEHWKKFGYGPSYEDIMRATGDKGRANLVRVIRNLCNLGVCKKLANKDRSVRPVYIKFRDLE